MTPPQHGEVVPAQSKQAGLRDSGAEFCLYIFKDQKLKFDRPSHLAPHTHSLQE